MCRVPQRIAQDLFRDMDADGSGEISPREFRRGMALLVAGTTKEQVTALYELFDVDRDQNMTLKEILKVFRPHVHTQREEVQQQEKKIEKRQQVLEIDDVRQEVSLLLRNLHTK